VAWRLLLVRAWPCGRSVVSLSHSSHWLCRISAPSLFSRFCLWEQRLLTFSRGDGSILRRRYYPRRLFFYLNFLTHTAGRQPRLDKLYGWCIMLGQLRLHGCNSPPEPARWYDAASQSADWRHTDEQARLKDALGHCQPSPVLYKVWCDAGLVNGPPTGFRESVHRRTHSGRQVGGTRKVPTHAESSATCSGRTGPTRAQTKQEGASPAKPACGWKPNPRSVW
jgi:hypothetical protein